MTKPTDINPNKPETPPGQGQELERLRARIVRMETVLRNIAYSPNAVDWQLRIMARDGLRED